MLLLIHNAGNVIGSRHGEKEILVKSSGMVSAIWKYAELYPEEIIAWCDTELKENINPDSWTEIFCHDLIMASYSIKNHYLTESVGYIDQLPFINVNTRVKYATWRMSPDLGGIKGKTLLKFKTLFEGVRSFNFLINSIGKLGQQNGLLCYSEPRLVKNEFFTTNQNFSKAYKASTRDLFEFVGSHYRKKRLILLFWCFVRYERRFPVLVLLFTFFRKSFLGVNVELSSLDTNGLNLEEKDIGLDVIIPTLGRPKYLLGVLKDLSVQTFLPKRVVVVEQNPDKVSISELPELQNMNWPFKIIHLFTHQTGACNARNLALEETKADWVFFADDDNKMGGDILEKAIQEIYRYSLDCITLHYPQENEQLKFEKIKQWGTFGAGNSIVSRRFCFKLRFDERFEYGYGEDKDYGMQLRNAGCDIVYHPNIKIIHLKAPRGGFRERTHVPWETEKPKPSPTLMLYAQKYFTKKQLKGYKEELFIRFYFRQKIKNPLKYYRWMNKKWKLSESWVQKLNNRQEGFTHSKETV